MDSQEQQKKQDSSKITNGGTDQFDREIRDLLKDAVLTPPADFFKVIEEALAESPTGPKQVAMANKARNAPEIQVDDKKIFFLKGFRRRWSYAASVGILILLSLGFWKLNLFSGKEKPITSILNSNTLLSEKRGPQEVAKGMETTRTPDKAAHQDTAPSNISVPSEPVANKITGAASHEKNKSTAVDPAAAHKIAALSTDRKSSSDSDLAKGIAPGRTAAAVQPKEQSPVTSTEKNVRSETGKQAVSSGTIAMKQPSLTSSKPISAADNHPEIPAVDLIEPKPQVAIAVSRNSHRNDRVSNSPPSIQDDHQQVDRQRERGGLFRGLVNHFKERVDEISNEVVMEDQQKTRIKVGCIAITTYK